MSDNLVLEQLRLMRDHMRVIEAKLDGLVADTREVKERLGFLEAGYASVSRRVDRVAGDVALIKRRLEIVDDTVEAATR